MIWKILGGILLKKVKRFLSLVLLVSVLMTTLCANPVFAIDDYAKYFTVESFPATRMVKDTTFTYKLTPKNAKDVLTLETENPKIIQVVSNVKKGNSYYCTIKAIGETGQVCQMYVQVKSKDSVAHPPTNYIIIKESKQAEAKRQAALREQESYEPLNDNYFSVINKAQVENDNSNSSVNAHFGSKEGSLIPSEFSVPQGSSVILSFQGFDTPTDGAHKAPSVSFSNPRIIKYDTSKYDNSSTKQSSQEIGTIGYDKVTRTINITAIGAVGESTQITVESAGRSRNFTIKIGEKISEEEAKKIGYKHNEKERPHIKGLYGITEIGTYDTYDMFHVGVLSPLSTPYDPSLTYEELLQVINPGGMNGMENQMTYPAAAASGYEIGAHIVQKEGKYGLYIPRWREFKKEGPSPTVTFYNRVLNVFCYLANDKKTGEALWKWMDDSYTNGGGIDTNDYGFVDDPGSTDGHWNMTFKRSGAKVEVVDEGISTIFYFTPKK